MTNKFSVARSFAGRVGAIAGSSVVAITMWMGLGGSIGAAPPPADPQTCLPSCSEVDGRMLVVAGDDDTTLAAVAIGIGLTYTQANAPNVNFEFFDGDANLDRWDSPYTGSAGLPGEKIAPDLIIELYRDVAGTGGTVKLATWGDPSSGVDQGTLAFTDNGWFGTTFPHDPLSLVPGSSPAIYRYALRILPSAPATHRGWNVFKVRAEGKVLLNGQQVFGFIAAMNLNQALGHPDVTTIYPNINIPAGPPFDLSGTTYNGVWTFQTTLSPFLTNVTVYDGDMDYGNQDCTFNDLDDPDSSGVPGFLAAGNNAVAEGVAVAESTQDSIKYCGGNPANNPRTGLPADDNGDAVNGPGLYERKPVTTVPNNVAYKLVAPGGQVFINRNPSGNREWEQFRIQLVAALADFDPADLCPAPNPGQLDPRKNPAGGYFASGPYPASDCRTNSLPGGVWDITLEGMDLNNLNFWFFDFTLEPPDPHYSIGRLVWYDANSNQMQDFCGATPCATEPGIADVTVTVRDGGPAGPIIATGITDANGEFLFNDGYLGVGINWPAGDYTVVVDATNFDPGGPLEGLTSTTGGEIENGIEVGLPACTDTGVPAGCGDPVYAEAIFGYVAPGTDGRNAPTQATCQDYIGGNIEEENEMRYSLSGNKIGNVTPGVIFFFTKVTVAAGQAVTVVQSHTGAGAGHLLLHGNQGRLLTLNCGTVTGWSATQNAINGTVSFPAVPPGTYVVQVKWSPKSLQGKPKPVPDTILYSFAAALNGVEVPASVNDPALALVKK